MTTDHLFAGPAVRVSQPIGEFWVTSIPAAVLLDSTVPDPLRLALDPRFEGTDEWRQQMRLLGNQRALHERRTKEIGRYIDSLESTFPNSIILAAETTADESGDSDVEPWRLEDAAGSYRLVIPRSARRASIVDGQHRLYGFLHTEVASRQSFELVCAVFFDIPTSMQAMVFATINTNQKPVRRGMALNLYGYNTEDEDRSVWSPEKLAVFIARRLNFDEENSRLYHRIKIEAEGAPPPQKLPGANRAVSLAAVVDGVLMLIASAPKRDRDTLRTERFLRRVRRADLQEDDSAPLRDWYRTSADAALYGLIREFVSVVDESVWRDAPAGSMLTRAVGIRALFGLLRASLRRLGVQEMSSSRNPAELLEEVGRVLRNCDRVDFGDPYFEATGRGQKRILNVLTVIAGWERVENIAGSVDEEATLHRLLRMSAPSCGVVEPGMEE